MTAAGIVGMGLWVPPEVRRNDAWPASFVERFARSKRRDEQDFTTVGARGGDRPYDELFVRHALPYEDDPFKGTVERRVSSPEEPTVVADTRAAMRALEDARVDPPDVDLILSSAMTPDRLVPTNASGIQSLSGCVDAAAIGVESYCSAALAQLDLAVGLVEAGRARFVLCVQSHHLARVNDLGSPISPLFGDGSSALVVGRVPDGYGLVEMHRSGDASLASAVTWARPQTPGACWWRDAAGPIQPGSDDLDQARRFTANLLAYPIDAVRDLCQAAHFDPLEARALVTMQPIKWFQPAVADGLGIPPERVPSTFERYAHMGAVGFVANLIEARAQGCLMPGAPVLFYSHGAGMTRYAALYRWTPDQTLQ